MKKLLITLLLVVVTRGVFATVGDDNATSKLYVDTNVATRQDAVDANDANTVMTYTDTAGTVGTKAIYDSTSSYAEQQNALVSADVANAAIMNAINMEFECAEWNPAFEEGVDCWKWRIHNSTPRPSGKNLFDLQNSKVLLLSTNDVEILKKPNGYTVTYPKTASNIYVLALVELGDINNFLGKTLKISAQSSCINGGRSVYELTMCDDDGGNRTGAERTLAVPEHPDANLTKVAFRLYGTAGGTGTNPSCTYYDIQVEEGTTATAYEPYQNLYLPVGQ